MIPPEDPLTIHSYVAMQVRYCLPCEPDLTPSDIVGNAMQAARNHGWLHAATEDEYHEFENRLWNTLLREWDAADIDNVHKVVREAVQRRAPRDELHVVAGLAASQTFARLTAQDLIRIVAYHVKNRVDANPVPSRTHFQDLWDKRKNDDFFARCKAQSDKLKKTIPLRPQPPAIHFPKRHTDEVRDAE